MNKRILLTVVVILCAATILVSIGLFIVSSRKTTPIISPEIDIAVDQSMMVTANVYFSHIPESYDTDFSFVSGTMREIIRTKPVESVLEELIKGPTMIESTKGLRSPIVLIGESDCDGKNFKIVSNLTQLGTDVEVHFCKDVDISGVGDTARIQSVINRSLLGLEKDVEFNVGRIAILDKNGNCLGDESGNNACLQ